MQAIGEETYCFAGFTLDLRRGSLRSGNAEIELRPKSFLLLRYLVENSGRLVSRDELIKAVWPDVIVTDESVTRCVSDVRMALGDSAQRIIKTLSKRGYVLTRRYSSREHPRRATRPRGRSQRHQICARRVPASVRRSAAN